MIVVYNQTFLNDILKQNNSVEIFEYSIISEFKSTTTPLPNTLLDLIQVVANNEKTNKIELEHKPLECIWEKDTNKLNFLIEFKEDLDKAVECDGIFVYYQLLGNPYTKNIAFTLLDSQELETTSTLSKIKNSIHLSQTKNLFNITLPKTVNAELYCYISNPDIKFLEGPGIEFGDNLYSIKEGSDNQLVSKESYIKYIREHNSLLPDKTAVRWLDENGMFNQSNIKFRNYTSINYQIGNLETIYYSIPTLTNLSKNGGEIQIFGYANYIDYEIDSTGNINQVGEGTESIASIPSVKIILKKAEDGFTATINNLTQTITYGKFINFINNLSPAGIFELVLNYYNPIDKEVVELKSGEFRLLQSETEGSWYISEFNTGFFEDNIPVYLVGNKRNDTTSFEITTTLTESNLENRKITIRPIEGNKKIFEDKFEINSTILSTSKANKVIVDIKAKDDNNKINIWAPYTTKTKDTEIDYIEIPEKTWNTYRTTNVMVGLDMNSENINISLSKSIEGLAKYINSLIDQENDDWKKFVEDYYPRKIINYLDLDWDVYQTGDSFFAINTEPVQKIILRENCEASLQNLNEILEKLKLGRTTFSLYSGTEQNSLEEEKRLEEITKGYGIFGWNNSLNNLYVNTKIYNKLIIKLKSPLSKDLELWIGNEYFGPDFIGKKYIIEKNKSEIHIDITSDSKLFEKINTIYFKTPDCNVHSENNKTISVQISNVYFYCPGDQYGIGEKKLYIDLAKIESIYNVKYSKLDYINNSISYIFDITGTSTGLSKLNEDVTEIGDLPLLYLVEISCNEYKTKFYAVQICPSKSIKAVVFNEFWKNLGIYNDTVNDNSYTFETSAESYIDQNFILVNNDREDFDDSSEEDENSWVLVNNPNGNITLNKSFGYLGHNPYVHSKDSGKGINITIQTENEPAFYGIKKYQSIVFCRTKKNEEIENNWKTLISRGLCFLNLSRKGTTQEINIVDNIRTIKVYGISHYTIKINANCPFCIDVSNITTKDYNIFGEYIDGAVCFKVKDSEGNYSDENGMYYSNFEDYTTPKTITFYLVKLKFNHDHDSWGYIKIYPQEKEDTFPDVLINVIADITNNTQTIVPFSNNTIARLESGEFIEYDPNTYYYDVFLGDKNNFVEFLCVDTYHPHGLLEFTETDSQYYDDTEEIGKMTELTPEFIYVASSYGYGYHHSKYTQRNYFPGDEYPLGTPRFKYTLYDLVNSDPSIDFYIWGKAKPLLINGEKSGNMVIYLFGNKETTREFSLSYPLEGGDILYRKFEEEVIFQENHSDAFHYIFQQKVNDPTKKVLTIKSDTDSNQYIGLLGKIILTFSLTEKGFIAGRSYDIDIIKKYVSFATLTIEVYQRYPEEEYAHLQTIRYFDRTFNGLTFPFEGAKSDIIPNWITVDNDKEKNCTIITEPESGYNENSDKYTFSGNSTRLRLEIPSRTAGSGYGNVPLIATDYRNYKPFFYGDIYYSGIAIMQTKETPESEFEEKHRDPFRVKQLGFTSCLVYKSNSEAYSRTRAFFRVTSANSVEEVVSSSTTTFECILAGVLLLENNDKIFPRRDYIKIPTITIRDSTVLCNIVRKDLIGWDLGSVKNCTITFPVNNSYNQKTYTILFEDKDSNGNTINRLTLNIIQEGVSGNIELLHTLSGVGINNLPYLSNGVFIGGEIIGGDLEFKTNIPLGELTLWLDDELIDSGYIEQQIVEDAEEGYFYARLKSTYTIPENKGETLKNYYLYFKRTFIDSNGNQVYVEIKKYKINQGYYCFKLSGRKDGEYLGSNDPAGDYRILSYGQSINTPWDSRIKFTQSLELHEVDIHTGTLKEETKLSNLEGSFNLTTGHTGLQKIDRAIWHYEEGYTQPPLNFLEPTTSIVWGEEIYEEDSDKVSEYPFLENTYRIEDLDLIKTAMNDIFIELIIDVKYPSDQTIIFTSDPNETNINSAINDFLRGTSLKYSYIIFLHKFAGTIPVFEIKDNNENDINSLTISNLGGTDSTVIYVDLSTLPENLGDINSSLINYSVTSTNTDWLSAELIDGPEKVDTIRKQLKITAAENNGAERIGNITININSPFTIDTNEYKKVITVTQQAAN